MVYAWNAENAEAGPSKVSIDLRAFRRPAAAAAGAPGAGAEKGTAEKPEGSLAEEEAGCASQPGVGPAQAGDEALGSGPADGPVAAVRLPNPQAPVRSAPPTRLAETSRRPGREVGERQRDSAV